MHANKLGNRVVGFLSELSSGQRLALREEMFQQASDVINLAIDQVTTLRGRLGAFERNTLQTNINQLQITIENLTSSESVIRDTDFAQETTEVGVDLLLQITRKEAEARQIGEVASR